MRARHLPARPAEKELSYSRSADLGFSFRKGECLLKPRQPPFVKAQDRLAPAMMRTRYHERRSAPLSEPDPANRPQLASDGDGAELDATAERLAHIAAGRIEVR
jgi:hypothetical protein